MPGFKIAGVGGDGPTNTLETRRKHRWLFKTIGDAPVNSVLIILQKANRPHYINEEAEMHHNQEQVYFAGKHRWDPITMTWYDGQQPYDASEKIWDWINIAVGIHKHMIPVQYPINYKKNAVLEMRDGLGASNETWNLYGCWPKDVNYDELDYTNTDIALVTVEMRYDRANRG